MTIFDKIEVKLAQFATLCTYILLSKRWFAWLMKVPVFVLFVCVWAITRPYEWTYGLVRTHHLKATDEFYEQAFFFSRVLQWV